MRTIKFRGKRLDNGEWIYGSYVPHYNFFGTIKDEMVDENGNLFEVDPATVGQYTGLKDKNGKEIYEGSIVKVDFLSDPVCEVRYYKDSFMAYQPHGLGYYVCKVCDACIIIGNIHDNPELLKGGER